MQNEILGIERERKNKQHKQDELSDINSPNYDPLHHIFQLFNEPSAFSEIDSMIERANSYQVSTKNKLLDKREEYKKLVLNTNAGVDQTDVDKLDDEVSKLLESFHDLRGQATLTGKTINSMTENIKKLDHSKKNLTFTLTTLKRLQMLVTAYDRLDKQLERQKNIRNYSEIRQLSDAVLELNQYFQEFKSIDEINKLNKLINKMKNQLIDDIFNDFELELNEDLKNDSLVDACHILEALGLPYKEKLQNWYLKAVLKDITNIFRSTEEAGSLDNINRRFIYFKNTLSNFESQNLSNFPKNWNMALLLTENFCNYTKNDIKDVLEKESKVNNSNTKADVNTLLNSLSLTLDFEQFLNKKFKYYKDVADPDHLTVPDFTKSISDAFEPHLNIWIDHQASVLERKIIEFSNPSIMFKKTGENASNEEAKADDHESLNVLESSAELFRIYRQLLLQLSKLTNGKLLIKLSAIFNKYLLQYQHKILETILPDSKSLISADLENQKEGVDLICLVLNTSDYCSLTVSQLADKIKLLIRPHDLAVKIDFDSSNNGFLQLSNYCINLLFYKVENDIQIAWTEMNSFNWKILDEITGESRYMESLKSIIKENCIFMFDKISRIIYTRNLIDKMVEMLLKKILVNIIKLQPITEKMAEQFKLDLQELKTFVNYLPTLTENGDKILSSKSFKTNLNSKFRNIDTLMKILMMSTKPMDTFINSYFEIVGDSNFNNFLKILRLKGVYRADSTSSEKEKFKYMDLFKLQIKSFEESPEALIESNEYFEKINLKNVTNTNVVRKMHTKSNSRSIYLPNTVGMSSSNSNLNSSAASSNTILSPSIPTPPEFPVNSETENIKLTETAGSPKLPTNFGFFNNSIDTNTLINKRDNLEKNLAKTFNNENIKKFFKWGDNTSNV